MSWKVTIVPRTLHFREPAGTSRGVYLTHDVWYVVLEDKEGRFGVGECAPLPDLSQEAGPDYEERLHEYCRAFAKSGDIYGSVPSSYPSVRFGLETALRHAQRGTIRLWDTPFSRGEKDITINGLVWMGSHDKMLERLDAKMKAGFHCVKLKIGAIGFDEECDLMRHIRMRYPDPGELELRLDANGGFTPENAMQRLEKLAEFRPHSIEQPIRQGQWEASGRLCASSPVPIALDEELIGLNDAKQKADMLDAVHPKYIILKPTLHGGLRGSEEWIRLAGERGIGFWATSALESNVGLNAIAQWRAASDCTMPQGLENLTIPYLYEAPLMLEQANFSAVVCRELGLDAPEPDLRSWLGLER